MYNPINYTITKHWYQYNSSYTCWALCYTDLDNRRFELHIIMNGYNNIFTVKAVDSYFTFQDCHNKKLDVINDSSPYSFDELIALPIEILKAVILRILDEDLSTSHNEVLNTYSYLNNDLGNLAFMYHEEDNENYLLSKELMTSQSIYANQLFDYLPLYNYDYPGVKQVYKTYIHSDNYNFEIKTNIWYYEEVNHIVIQWELQIYHDYGKNNWESHKTGWEFYKGTVEELENIFQLITNV
jgi:hypothetical protein